MKNILNLAAGKIDPILSDKELKNSFIVNVDQMYDISKCKEINTVEEIVGSNNNCIPTFMNNITTKVYLNENIYTFLETFIGLFDKVAIYRFLEHVPKTQVLYFLYILSTVIKIGGEIDVIVPDYKKLAEMILSENVKDPNFEARDIITTFELLNEPSCPHASIWTEERIYHFVELEGRFKVTEIIKDFDFDGRDIYLRFFAKRVK